jgi:hypothetical protein
MLRSSCAERGDVDYPLRYGGPERFFEARAQIGPRPVNGTKPIRRPRRPLGMCPHGARSGAGGGGGSGSQLGRGGGGGATEARFLNRLHAAAGPKAGAKTYADTSHATG